MSRSTSYRRTVGETSPRKSLAHRHAPLAQAHDYEETPWQSVFVELRGTIVTAWT